MILMTKELSKEIMKRSRLCNNFLRNRTKEIKVLYNRQRIIVYLFCKNVREDTMKT